MVILLPGREVGPGNLPAELREEPAPASGPFVLPEGGNMPGVVFGPGDASTAHTPREQVKVEDLINTVRVLARAIVDWCGTEHRAED